MDFSLHIFIDEKAVNTEGWSIRTVGELVQQLSSLPEFEHRVIVSIVVNGLIFHDWEDNRTLELPTEPHVHVKTQTVIELLVSTAQSAKEYLPKLEEGAAQIATLIHEGREAEAFRLVAQLIEGLQWYSDVLGNVAALVPPEKMRASQRLSALRNVVQQLLQSWEGKDHTLLADLLEYELSAELQTGLEYVELLSQSDFSAWENRE